MNKNKIQECCNSVIPTNAARPFKKPAYILTNPAVIQLLDEKPRANILELGAGSLRNSLYLQEKGFLLSVLEIKGIEKRFPEQYKKFGALNNGQVFYKFPFGKKYEFVICTFVIETICNPEQRVFLLTSSLKVLKLHGTLLISVRGPKDLVTAVKSGIPCSDGYLTPGYSFSRSYTPRQLTELLISCGYANISLLHKATTKEPEYLHAIAFKE